MVYSSFMVRSSRSATSVNVPPAHVTVHRHRPSRVPELVCANAGAQPLVVDQRGHRFRKLVHRRGDTPRNPGLCASPGQTVGVTQCARGGREDDRLLPEVRQLGRVLSMSVANLGNGNVRVPDSVFASSKRISPCRSPAPPCRSPRSWTPFQPTPAISGRAVTGAVIRWQSTW